MIGIILAGGEGTRCYPNTLVTSKHLLALYDKPIIYYSIGFLFEANIRNIVIVTSARDIINYQNLLGDGSNWGASFRYLVQEKALGTAHAITLAEKMIGTEGCVLIYGDNYINSYIASEYISNIKKIQGATIFICEVDNPESYGVVEISKDNQILSIEEKPIHPKSNYALIGLMCFDQSVCEKIEKISLSRRGEYEITDVIKLYLKTKELQALMLEKKEVWSDLGNPKEQTIISYKLMIDEEKNKRKEGCLEEIAYKKGWINSEKLLKNIKKYINSPYGKYLVDLVKHFDKGDNNEYKENMWKDMGNDI